MQFIPIMIVVQKNNSEHLENIAWFDSNYTNLKNYYLYEFVAIYDKKVIDHDPILNKLLERLRGRKGYQQDLGSWVFAYIQHEESRFIF